ncbi:MAG: hypothetical protein AB1Z66_05670, partial [Candidatus Limnocylindrales bacterium]
MDPIAAGQLRRSRLGRLRDANVREAAEIVRSPQLPAPHPDRARRLARDVGGEVLQTTQRPIVVVESRERIPRALDGLGVLPEP